MIDILKEDENFQAFAKYCEKKSDIEKDLSNPQISKEGKDVLKRHIVAINQKISELELKIQDKVKVS